MTDFSRRLLRLGGAMAYFASALWLPPSWAVRLMLVAAGLLYLSLALPD